MTAVFRERPGGIDLFVRLTPKAAADRIDGVETTADGRMHLAARVRAVPEKGAANAALERLIAETLGIGRSRVTIVAGQTARIKTVRAETDAASIRTVLAELPLVK